MRSLSRTKSCADCLDRFIIHAFFFAGDDAFQRSGKFSGDEIVRMVALLIHFTKTRRSAFDFVAGSALVAVFVAVFFTVLAIFILSRLLHSAHDAVKLDPVVFSRQHFGKFLEKHSCRGSSELREVLGFCSGCRKCETRKDGGPDKKRFHLLTLIFETESCNRKAKGLRLRA